MDNEHLAKELLHIGNILAEASQIRQAADDPAQLFSNTFSDAPQILDSLGGYNSEDISSFDDAGPFVLNVGGKEWHGYESEEDALRMLEEHLKGNLDNDVAVDNLNVEKARNFFSNLYRSQDAARVNTLAEVPSKHGYGNALVDELVAAKLMGPDKQADGKEHIEKYLDFLVNEKINEGEGGLEHYRFVYGDDEAANVCVQNNLFDTTSAAKALWNGAVKANNSRWFRMS